MRIEINSETESDSDEVIFVGRSPAKPSKVENRPASNISSQEDADRALAQRLQDEDTSNTLSTTLSASPSAGLPSDTSDEKFARELQAMFDKEERMAAITPSEPAKTVEIHAPARASSSKQPLVTDPLTSLDE
jgi:hypothetical protein